MKTEYDLAGKVIGLRSLVINFGGERLEFKKKFRQAKQKNLRD